MKSATSFLLISFLLLANAYGCPSSNGDEIEIMGRLKIEIYPGAPNYEDIIEGDKPEKCWFVVLNKSICFSPDNEFLSEEIALTKIQLIFNGSEQQLREGKIYFINGVTVPAHTGHHHSDVLLNVKSIKELQLVTSPENAKKRPSLVNKGFSL